MANKYPNKNKKVPDEDFYVPEMETHKEGTRSRVRRSMEKAAIKRANSVNKKQMKGKP